MPFLNGDKHDDGLSRLSILTFPCEGRETGGNTCAANAVGLLLRSHVAVQKSRYHEIGCTRRSGHTRDLGFPASQGETV